MCIIFLLYQVHPTYPLIIASNRDETLDRPTESMKLRSIIDDPVTSSATAISSTGNTRPQDDLHSEQQPSMRQHQRQRRRSSLAGKDLVCGGTWLALDVSSLNIDLDIDDDDDGTTNSGRSKCCIDTTTFDSVNLEPKKDNDNNQASNNSNSSTTPSLLRWIAITNYREKEQHGRPSRGGLLTEYISSQSSAESFVTELQQKGHEYNGFNFFVGDDTGIYYCGNRSFVQGVGGGGGDDDNTTTAPPSTTQRLTPGRIYGLSNALLDTPWPKVQRGKELLEQLLHKEQQKMINNNNNKGNNSNSSSLKQLHEELLTILSDTTQPNDDNLLPNTGISLHSERHLSSIFVPVDNFMGKEYGTRSSTSIVMDVDGCVSVLERSWLADHREEVVDEWFHFGKRK